MGRMVFIKADVYGFCRILTFIFCFFVVGNLSMEARAVSLQDAFYVHKQVIREVVDTPLGPGRNGDYPTKIVFNAEHNRFEVVKPNRTLSELFQRAQLRLSRRHGLLN
uniref:NAGLU_N domain-containing protein n=1 Tax=Panagrellus redivivus TaxID=6233 RepID=A0A7E4WCB4_PANRE